MEVNFSETIDIGEIDVDCPFCNGEGYYYVMKMFKRPKGQLKYVERECIVCQGAGSLTVNAGDVEVSGTTEVERDSY